MRRPLWILNSVFLLLLIAALCFIMFTRQSEPVWEDLALGTVKPIQKKISEINISKIYDYDLFGTYHRSEEAPQSPNYVTPIPPAPSPRRLSIPEEAKPTFLDPLKVSLKGIIAILNDDTKNRAIIADTRTKAETVYKVGDMIDDAQLIKIFNKKVIFLRSNGQQEVLYLRPKDAQLDPAYAIVTGWKGIAQKVTDTAYRINRYEFVNRIASVAQFIDLLALTTVYKKGKSIGSRIGKIESNSLGSELGFAADDVIVKVNGIPATDVDNRLLIVNKIAAMKTKDTITVDLLRNKAQISLVYTIEDDLTQSPAKPSDAKAKPVEPALTHEQLEHLEERHKFAPTLQEIRIQEREKMLKKGRLPRKSVGQAFQ